MKKELVVAAYDKELNWLNSINKDVKISVYRKGKIFSLKDNEIFIEPNLGRCVHSFFNHILINYDNLSDITFFCQDFPFDHWGNITDIINGEFNYEKTASITIGGYYGYHNNTFGSAWNLSYSQQFGGGNVLSCYSNGYPQDTNPKINVDKYWNLLFNGNPPIMYEFMPGGHFCITKEQILIRTKEFYKKIVDFLLEDEIAPWIIERLECYIFNQNFKTNI